MHDYLIRRGIQLRKLEKGYNDCDSSGENAECCVKSTAATADASRDRDCDCGSAQPSPQTLIFMADGKWMHGGLTDRLRGMASAFDFAQSHHLQFKIYHTSPFPLQEILLPNKVNWFIDKSEISYNRAVAKPALLYREDFENIRALERQLDASHKQFHLYSCVDTLGDTFAKRFWELFKPSPLLQEELDRYSEMLGNYVAYSFRFQNLLGDFSEFTFKELPAQAKQELLNAALQSLQRVIADCTRQNLKILVTADSPIFLEEAAKFSEVVTVKGKSVHIDFDKSRNANDYLKSFTEYFLIAKAQKALLYRNKKFNTYPSNFPKYAAALGGVPFEVVED